MPIDHETLSCERVRIWLKSIELAFCFWFASNEQPEYPRKKASMAFYYIRYILHWSSRFLASCVYIVNMPGVKSLEWFTQLFQSNDWILCVNVELLLFVRCLLPLFMHILLWTHKWRAHWTLSYITHGVCGSCVSIVYECVYIYQPKLHQSEPIADVCKTKNIYEIHTYILFNENRFGCHYSFDQMKKQQQQINQTSIDGCIYSFVCNSSFMQLLLWALSAAC